MPIKISSLVSLAVAGAALLLTSCSSMNGEALEGVEGSAFIGQRVAAGFEFKLGGFAPGIALTYRKLDASEVPAEGGGALEHDFEVLDEK